MLVKSALKNKADKSRPTRGAWIEISGVVPNQVVPRVAPHTGRVD